MSNETYQKRSSNFSTEEVEYLLELVNKYVDIIDCKKTDRIVSEKKARVWKHIEEEFNNEFGQIVRSDKALKTKYDNYKKLERKKYGRNNKLHTLSARDFVIEEISQPEKLLGQDHQYFNGGDVIKEEIEEVELAKSESDLVVLNAASFDDMLHDDDDDDGSTIASDPITTERVTLNNTNSSSATANWPKTLQNSRSPNNANFRKKNLKDKWDKLAAAKLEKVNLETEFLKREHELNVQKLQLEIQILKRKLNGTL